MIGYTEFYGVKTSAFNVTSNPEVFYESDSHKKALASLMYGIEEKKGMILITGEVGTGKTTLCKILLNRLSKKIKTSLILNPYFSEIQLLKAIVEDFGLELKKKNRLDIMNSLNQFLIDINIAGGNAVLIIDEAQNLANRQLEQIRLLSNLETSQEKLLQIILVGQPELKEKLERFSVRQIKQRIFVKYSLAPLNQEEVKAYVEFRLKKAGQIDIVIAPESYELIYNFSGGIPRLVNMLCDRALLCGYSQERRFLDENIFKTCMEELK